MRFLLSSLFVLLLATCGRSQLGLHPPSADWQQIDLPEGRIIFPKGFEDRAKRVASLIELLEAKHTQSIGEKHYRFDLILQTANTTINGYVGLAPFRSEFFLTPPQGQNLLSAGDWSDLLTVHEYRHVQQNSNERRGITKLASYLFGQQGWAGFSSLATPNWFSEGDAVVAETAFSKSGRGRTPAFSAPLRSLLANDIVYSYPTARNGSFKKLVPSHYPYGYALMTYARERFGNDVWKSVLHDGASYKGIFYSFSRALRKKTDYKTHQLYQTTMADLKRLQDSAFVARGPEVAGSPLGQEHKSVVDYRFPQQGYDSRIYALRSGFQYRPALVKAGLPGEKDEVLTYVGIQREPYVDVRGQFAVWMENRQHPRYTNLQYSEIIFYDIDSRQRRQLTTEGKYFSPSISHDEKEIVAVRHDPLAGDPLLVILDIQSGEVKEEYLIAATSIAEPRFTREGRIIYFLHKNYNGIAIQALDRDSGNTSTVRERTTENLDHLRISPGDRLTFSSGRDGVDNVYQFNPVNGETVQLTNERIGALHPRMNQAGELYYVTPTPKGLRLRGMAIGAPGNNGLYKNLASGLNPTGPSIYERPAAYAEEAVDLSTTVEIKDYPTSNVSDKLFGYKLHSWALAGSQVAPGFAVQGGNALNTIETTATVLYNTNNDELVTQAAVSYGGWFPVVTGVAAFSERQFTQIFPGLDTTNRLTGVTQNLNQASFGLTASVPLNWVRGEFRTQVVPSAGLTQFILKDRLGEELPANFTGGRIGLNASTFRRRAFQQVFSTLGATISTIYDRGFGQEETGSRFLLRSRLQLPGLHRTHGIRLSFDYQQENSQNPYQYSDFFQYSRGYNTPLSDDVYRLGADYQLPVLYPDIGFLGIYYLKRIRLDVFADHGRYNLAQLREAQTINSAGVQFLFDGTTFNVGDVSFGVEVAWLLSNHVFGGSDKGRVRSSFLAVTTF